MLSRVLPILMPAISVIILTFGLGVFVAEYKVPPYRSIANGAKTIEYALQAFRAPLYFGQFGNRRTTIDPDTVSDVRFTAGPDATRYPGTFLIVGGLNEYRELCPDAGCLGIEIDRTGAVLQSWPFKPAEILAADITAGEFPHEGVPADPAHIFRPLSLQRYDNGDILVTFQSTGAMFPFAAGVARIAPDGTPVWYRFDYSHHWATMLPDGRTLVPDLAVADGDWIVPVGPKGHVERLECRTGKPQVDGIHIVAPDGSIEKRIDVAAALLDSPWAPMLVETYDACDPLHINYVDVLNETAPGQALKPGHLLVSLRNLSAVAVIDPATEEVTSVVRGNFTQQHSVQHLEGSKVLMFDNWGGDAFGQGSRLLEVDMNGGERRVFPRPSAPEFADQLFSNRGSHLDISADRTRALVTFSGEGKAFEVDIGSGRVILNYHSLHDLRGIEGVPAERTEGAGQANMYGMYYAD